MENNLVKISTTTITSNEAFGKLIEFTNSCRLVDCDASDMLDSAKDLEIIDSDLKEGLFVRAKIKDNLGLFHPYKNPTEDIITNTKVKLLQSEECTITWVEESYINKAVISGDACFTASSNIDFAQINQMGYILVKDGAIIQKADIYGTVKVFNGIIVDVILHPGGRLISYDNAQIREIKSSDQRPISSLYRMENIGSRSIGAKYFYG